MNRDLKFFLLGFFASREGFNGECAFSHLARDSIFSGDCSCELSDLAEFNPAENEVDTELNRLFGDAQGLVGDDKREPS